MVSRDARFYEKLGVVNVAHIRQSRPDSGLGFQANILETFKVFPSLLGSGLPARLPLASAHGQGCIRASDSYLSLNPSNFSAETRGSTRRMAKSSTTSPSLPPPVCVCVCVYMYVCMYVCFSLSLSLSFSRSLSFMRVPGSREPLALRDGAWKSACRVTHSIT